MSVRGSKIQFIPLVTVVVGFWPSSRSRHVSHHVRSVPSEQRTQHASMPIMSLRRKPQSCHELATRIHDYHVPFRDHISLGHPSGCWTWMKLFCYSEAPASAIKALSEDFHFHSNDKSAMRSPRITESVAHPDLFPCHRHCTTQAVVITLQLSGRLWIKTNSSAYQSNNICAIKTFARSVDTQFEQ